MSRPRRGGALAVAGVFGIAFAVTAWNAMTMTRYFVVPDEVFYVKAALSIWQSPPLVTPGSGNWFVSWSQLLPLLDAVPLGAAPDMVVGIKLAHLLGAAAMSLTAVPAYLLAREVIGDTQSAILVAALSVALPWLAMTSGVLTEVVAYPAFTWAAYAIVRACTRPGPRSDAVALAAVAVAMFARAQLVFLAALLLVATIGAARRERRPLEVHRVALGATGLAVVVLAVRLIATGDLTGILGSYSSVGSSSAIDLAISGKVVAYVAVAVAAVPFVIGVPWIASRLITPARPAEFAFGLVAATALLVLVAQSGLEISQPGRVQDRYLVYALPLLFTAMAAALLRGGVRARWIALAGVLLAALVSRFDFFETGAELTSLSFTWHGAIGRLAGRAGEPFGITDLNPGLFLGVLTLAVAALAALAVNRGPSRRRLHAFGLVVLVICAAQTADAFRLLRQSHAPFGYVEPAHRAWIDDAVPSGARVGLVVGSTGNLLTTPLSWTAAGFWNRRADRYYVTTGPQGSLPSYGQPSPHSLHLDPRSGIPREPGEWWVVSRRDPGLRARGGAVVAVHGPLELRRGSRTSPVAFGLQGRP